MVQYTSHMSRIKPPASQRWLSLYSLLGFGFSSCFSKRKFRAQCKYSKVKYLVRSKSRAGLQEFISADGLGW